MDERQFNALRSCEQTAAGIASRHGIQRPHFYLPAGGDLDIEFWRALEAISAFLQEIDGQEPDSPIVEVVPMLDLKESVQSATIEELTAIPGIGLATAKRIKAAI